MEEALTRRPNDDASFAGIAKQPAGVDGSIATGRIRRKSTFTPATPGTLRPTIETAAR
jgi:hypothetical protein